jgi:Protein of unknown function (DUF3179)
MKKLFFLGVILLIFFELANVYFIMPVPGSQEMNSIDVAYFLHSNRWIIRGIAGVLMLAGFMAVWKKYRWWTILFLLITGGTIYITHCEMAADTMFYQPNYLNFQPAINNEVEPDRLVLGIEHNGIAKAYPIQFIGYHHQVHDTLGGKPVIVTYCTVCRSGRVYEPIVNGKTEKFRLVGMDHYNAMFEDPTTKSWWRQVTGEAIAGPLKGQQLPEFPSTQTTLETWLELFPNSLVMQPDTNFAEIYAELSDFESGQREGRLTRRDTASWKEKSWIAGVVVGEKSKAYDWNVLVKQRVINDVVGDVPVVVLVAKDQNSLFGFIRQSATQEFFFRNDTLTDGDIDYNLLGVPKSPDLQPLRFLQVYPHTSICIIATIH